jgi:hypothetical protein
MPETLIKRLREASDAKQHLLRNSSVLSCLRDHELIEFDRLDFAPTGSSDRLSNLSILVQIGYAKLRTLLIASFGSLLHLSGMSALPDTLEESFDLQNFLNLKRSLLRR